MPSFWNFLFAFSPKYKWTQSKLFVSTNFNKIRKIKPWYFQFLKEKKLSNPVSSMLRQTRSTKHFFNDDIILLFFLASQKRSNRKLLKDDLMVIWIPKNFTPVIILFFICCSKCRSAISNFWTWENIGCGPVFKVRARQERGKWS